MAPPLRRYPPDRVRRGQVLDVEVVVVGAGVAGLVVALDLAEARPGTRVAVVDKGAMGATGSTPLAQGGMAAAVGPDDSPARHAADTRRAGEGLCDPAAVAVLASEAPARVADLERRGARLDRHADGTLHLAREGAHSVPRCVHAADATGAEIFRALRSAAAGAGDDRPVVRLQGAVAAVATVPGPAGWRACGVWALLDEGEASASGPAQDAGLVLVRAQAVVLATGGCGGLYASTTNRDGATGDGVALGYAAGAAVADVEFVQFHPTGLAVPARPGEPRLLLTEALRGAGAVLVDEHGRRFMPERHPDAELAPRHVVARGILDQPGGAWLDATALGGDRLAVEFPTVAEGARARGFDLAREPVPVEPTQHYLIGGVATDLWGRSTLDGLWAVGEVACAGVHGANRVAGNSLAQSCVFAHRAAVALAASLGDAVAPGEPEPPAFGPPATRATGELRAEVRASMSAGAGGVRTAATLEGADKVLRAVADRAGTPAPERAALELAHGVVAARLIVQSALLRTESRGAHWREDAPAADPRWDGVRLHVRQPG